MDSLAESVTRKRDELAKLQQQAAERDARIAKLQAAEKAAEKTELYDEFFKQRPPEPELTEAQKKEKWDRVEAERSAMQQNAPCGFDAAKLFPEMYPEQDQWRIKPPEQIPPEPTEEVTRKVGIGQVGIVQFGPDSKLAVRVLSAPENGIVKATPYSGMMVGRVIEVSVTDFS